MGRAPERAVDGAAAGREAWWRHAEVRKTEAKRNHRAAGVGAAKRRNAEGPAAARPPTRARRGARPIRRAAGCYQRSASSAPRWEALSPNSACFCLHVHSSRQVQLDVMMEYGKQSDRSPPKTCRHATALASSSPGAVDEALSRRLLSTCEAVHGKRRKDCSQASSCEGRRLRGDLPARTAAHHGGGDRRGGVRKRPRRLDCLGRVPPQVDQEACPREGMNRRALEKHLRCTAAS